METEILILASTVMFAAIFIGAVGGFGSGIFAMSLLVLFLPLKTAVVSLAFATFLSNVQLSWGMREKFPLRSALPIVAGRLPGVLLGVCLLRLPIDWYAKILLSAIIVVMALRELFFAPLKRGNLQAGALVPYPTGIGLGLISGVLNGWVNMGGPPIIVYSYKNFEAGAARRLLIATFTLTYPFQLPMYWIGGLITKEAMILFAWFVPVTVLGTIAGNRFQQKINRRIFVRIVWAILLALGVILGITTLLK
jgi:uncharacterized membrane protein YfcA